MTKLFFTLFNHLFFISYFRNRHLTVYSLVE